MKSCFSLCLTATAALALTALAPIHADEVAADFDSLGSGSNYRQGSYSLGWAFTVKKDTLVTELGFYDSGQDGIHGDHPVGIYDRESEALLVSTTVTPSDPLTGYFRYHKIEPLALKAGKRYCIMAVNGQDSYAIYLTDAVVKVSDAITYERAAVYYGTSSATALHFPDEFYPGVTTYDDFGPNFKIKGGTTEPPPSSSAAAATFTEPTVVENNGNTSLGWLFTPAQDIVVRSVGYYDDKGDGFIGNHLVAIWDAVEKRQVVGESTVTTNDELRGGFRYHAIAVPATLLKGHPYFVMGTSGADPYASSVAGLQTHPALTFQGTAFYGDRNPLGAAFPDRVDKKGTGIFGPNFEAEFGDEDTAKDSLFAAAGFKSAGTEISGVNQSLGWLFTPKQDITINTVGYYDDGAGQPQPHTVAIWDAVGKFQIVGDTQVTANDPLRGHFRYHSIVRTTLLKDHPYAIVGTSGLAKYVTAAKKLTVSPLVTFGGAVFSRETNPLGAAFPDTSDTKAKGYFGPNFEIVPGNGQFVTVSVNATTISREAGQTASITLTRGGLVDLTRDIVVRYTVSGPLVDGRDYESLKGQKKIKAGKSTAQIKIRPLPGGANGKVTFTLLPSEDYDAPAPAAATVKITD